MRFCHLADSHLGAGEGHERRAPSGLTCRQEDIIGAFRRAIDQIIALKPDFCLHAGDLFDRVRPLNSIMSVAAETLHCLAAEAGIPTVVILGNHDAPRQPHIGAAIEVFRQIPNLHMVAGSERRQIRLGDCTITALPHCMTADLLQRELARCRPDPASRYNVLMMHGVVAGMPEFSMADLGEQQFPVEVMAPFDYTALGHYHNFRQVTARAWYAGSTERLSQAERSSAKGFVEVRLEPFDLRFHEVTTRPMIDTEPLRAVGKRGDELGALLKERLAQLDSSDKIVRVNIEGASAETLKTLPTGLLDELKRRAYDLDIRIQRDTSVGPAGQFGRSAIGRLDQAFADYLASCDLAGFDRERLLRDAARLLAEDE